MNLYIIATPIGNLSDITLRALETLKNVDLILAEDTRVTKKLLLHYKIEKPVWSYHEHSSPNTHQKIVEELRQGKKIALVTDAGTPCVSDPGAKLIRSVTGHLPSVVVSPIPGPSALISALSASGLNSDQFTFLGYPPHKKGRNKFFKELKDVKTRPLVLYESPHRLQKTLLAISENFDENQEIIIAKELTKIHEEIWRGTVKNAAAYFVNKKGRGEFVLIIP